MIKYTCIKKDLIKIISTYLDENKNPQRIKTGLLQIGDLIEEDKTKTFKINEISMYPLIRKLNEYIKEKNVNSEAKELLRLTLPELGYKREGLTYVFINYKLLPDNFKNNIYF